MGRRAGLLLLALWGCAGQPRAYGPIVRDVRIEGARQISAHEVRGHLETQKTSWFPFAPKSRFDPDVWRTDLRRVERYYRERGFYQAKVVSAEVFPEGEDGVRLTVRVVEGPRTGVKDVSIQGLEGLSQEQRDFLWNKLPLHPGNSFVEGAWEAVFSTLRYSLRDLGYAEAEVEGQAEVDLEQHIAHLRLRARPGTRYQFGDVQVQREPNAQVPAWRIQERVEQALRDSPYYSETAKLEAQRRVVQMGVFGSVEVRNGEPDPLNARMPVVVDAHEAPFHSLRGGGGLGLDLGLFEVRAVGQYTHRNFFGGLRRLTVNAKAGYALFSPFTPFGRASTIPHTGPIALLSAELRQPRVIYPALEALARVTLERTIEPAYAYFGARARVGLSWQPLRHLTITPTYAVEAYRQDTGSTVLGTNAPALLFNCPKRCLLSYLEQVMEYDRRDNKLAPKRGYYLSLGLQEGGGLLGGVFDYFRFLPDARIYLTPEVLPRLTLAGRLRLGSLNPASHNPADSPSVSRFYSGGPNQMRGFGTRRLSPLVVVPLDRPVHGYTGQAVPVGGNALIESSVEARYQTHSELAFATFADAGAVTARSLDFGPLNDTFSALQLAVGLGVRYRTPAGPLRLDLAYRPNVGRPLEVAQLNAGINLTYPSPTGCFGIGSRHGTRAGSPEGPCAINLSIGEAF